MDRISVILDTDIGSDIDDAIALAYLLKHPACDLLGITVVTGDVQKRAALCEVVCNSVGRSDIPIHCGYRDVLKYGPGQPNVPQYEAIRDKPHRMDRPENTAVGFLRDTIRQRPGEVVLLTIGPFTNIGVLFEQDPDIPMLVKSIVSMAGIFYEPGKREWNALVDPVATNQTYGARRKDHVSVGLDVTMKCQMSPEDVRAQFVGEPLKTVRTFAEAWFQGSNKVIFHDPLAAALIFKPGICTYESGTVTSPLSGQADADGETILTHGAGSDRVAKTVDSDAFFEEFFSVTVS